MNEYDDILATESAAGKAKNEYDGMVEAESVAAESKQALRASLYGAVTKNPDEYARARRAGGAIGVPPDVAHRNLSDVERRAKLNEYDALLDTSPKLAAQLQNPTFASVAHDDIDTLGRLEGLIQPSRGPQPGFGSVLSGIRTSFVEGAERARQGIRLQLADLLGFDTTQADALRKIRSSQSRQSLSDPEFESPTGRGLYAGGSSLAQAAPGVAASILTRSPTPMLAAAGGQVEAEAYGKYRARGATGGEAFAGAVGEGATEVATELLPMGFLVKQFGRVGAGQFLAGLLAREIPSEQVATIVQDAIDTAIANPDKSWSEYLAERPGAAYETLLATLVQSAAFGAAHKTAQRLAQRAEGAQVDAQQLKKLSDVASESKLRERDPETFKAFIKATADDGPVTHVYVDASQFAGALAQSGIDPQSIAQVMPDLAVQLVEASATQGDLQIPLEDFATHLAGTPVGDALLPHLRTDPEALSQTEAAAYFQGENDKLQAEVQQAAQARAVEDTMQSVNAVRESILAQLGEANRFTADVNRPYADLMAAFFATTAARLGVTPQQLYERFAPTIVSQIDLAPAQRLDQADQADQEGSPGTQAGSAGQSRDLLPEAAPELADPAAADQYDGALLQPGRTDANRGAYVPETRTIALLQNADLSTFLHESGHFYLEVLTEIAGQPDAPADVATDVQKLLDWFGVPQLSTWQAMPLAAKRPFHERFARGFEAYLFEGNAPSEELQGAFARFRTWLLNVYRSLKALNVELSDDVRGVFDRMLATDAQISDAETARQYGSLFETAEQAGMTPEEFADYQSIGRGATREAVDELQRRSLRDMRWLSNAKGRALRDLQREGNEKRVAVRAEVEAEVMADPVYRARHFLMRGELPLGETLPDEFNPVKLSTPAIKEMYGGDQADAILKALPVGQYGMRSAKGVHPDVIAEAFGFSSGDELVRKLVAAPKPAEVIEGLTDQRMLERYGDISDQQSLEREAEAAIHNDVRARFLEREVNTLEKAVGNRPTLRRVARAYAAQAIAQKEVRAVKPSQYTAAESRVGREATTAFKAGDTRSAAELKRAQLLNHELAREAGRTLSEIDKAVTYLAGFNRDGIRQSIEPEYRAQIDALLERFDLRRSVTLKQIAKRRSLAEFVEQQREMGLEPTIDDRLLNEATRQHYRSMTVEQLRGLVDAVKNIEHLGRLKRKLLTAMDQREFAAHVADVEQSIRENATKTIKAKIESELPRDRAGRLLKQIFASHRKVGSLVRQMDGVKDGGAFWSVFVRPMNDAGGNEAVLREQAAVALGKLFKPLEQRGGLDTKVFIPEINSSLTKRGRLAVALNQGNATNRQRLRDGEGWTDAQVQAVLDTLTPEDWDFVQGVWDFINSYWPAIEAKQKRVSGIAEEKVQAEPFQVSDKAGNVVREMRGGYYPIHYDPARSSRAEADVSAEAVRQTMQGLYTRAATRRGHTKARVETVVRPLNLSLGVIFEHVDQVIHDLAWHEWLIDANRLVRAPAIDAAIREHYGPEVLQTMRDALRDIAQGEIPAQSGFERGMNHLRTGATIAGLGWNVMTSLMQPLGLSQSMARIGPKWVARGLARWIGDAARMENTAAWITERSDLMRLRAKTMQREINEIRNRIDKSGPRAAIEASFFYLIQKAQQIADIPTWMGAYEKAIDGGANEARAVSLADQAVLDSQGGGQIKDLSAIQRGPALQKLFTNFYSFFNTTYNLTAESVARTDFKDPVSIGRLAVDFLLLYTLPAVLGALIKHALTGDDDDPEELAKKLVREQVTYLLGTMVGVREASAAVQAAFGEFGDYGGPAGVRFFNDLAKLGKQVSQGDVDEALLKAANSAAGVLFHYPAGQVQRTALGIKAVIEGKAGPHAVLFGPPRK